jgi:hypothetical protein
MLSIYSIANFVAMFFLLSLGLVIYVGDKNETNRAYARYAAVNAMLAFFIALAMMISRSRPDIVLTLARLCYWTGIVIPSTYFYFALVYPNNGTKYNWVRRLLELYNLLMLYIFVFTDKIATKITFFGPHPYDIATTIGPWAPLLFHAVYAAFMVAIFGILFYKWRTEKKDLALRRQNGSLFFLALIDFGPTSFVGVILPVAGTFSYIWANQLLTLFWALIVSYLIFRRHLFNIRVVASEMLVLGLLTILFFNIFANDLQNLSGPLPETEINATTTSAR